MKAGSRFLLMTFYVAAMLVTAFPLQWLLIEAAFYVHLRHVEARKRALFRCGSAPPAPRGLGRSGSAGW
jgi:hypothetical protein